MKFVKLTNTGKYRDNPIFINIDHITSVFEEPTNSGSLSTVVFSVSGHSHRWVVEEGLSEVMKKIKEVSNESS